MQTIMSKRIIARYVYSFLCNSNKYFLRKAKNKNTQLKSWVFCSTYKYFELDVLAFYKIAVNAKNV